MIFAGGHATLVLVGSSLSQWHFSTSALGSGQFLQVIGSNLCPQTSSLLSWAPPLTPIVLQYQLMCLPFSLDCTVFENRGSLIFSYLALVTTTGPQ